MPNPLPDFEYEMATTRRLLERVPTKGNEWKPHVKSFSLAHLAQLVSRMPSWITQVLTHESQDLAEFPEYSVETTETLLAEFDRNVAEARRQLESATEEQLDVRWSLMGNGHTFFSAPRREVIRSNLNHLVHHRGQLSVYLRMVDVPLPPIYGPTADERM